MPPKSVGSALALVSLSALTVVEIHGCDNRLESLGSAARSGLPLIAQAAQSNGVEMNYALADYSLIGLSDLRHVCGHYELRADGKLATWDLFAATIEADQLKQRVEREMLARDKSKPPHPRADIDVLVKSRDQFAWPRSCPKALASKSKSILWASRVL
jgi:hypothetical protein